MPIFIEYDLDDDSTILIESSEDIEGVVKAALGEVAIIKAKKKFTEVLQEVKVQARLLLKELEELHIDEAEIKFGLTTTGELGNMAICKMGMDVNYEITLKWKKPRAESKKE